MRVVVEPNASCDHCEEAFDSDAPTEAELNEELLREGWLIVQFGRRIYDFCTPRCLSTFFLD